MFQAFLGSWILGLAELKGYGMDLAHLRLWIHLHRCAQRLTHIHCWHQAATGYVCKKKKKKILLLWIEKVDLKLHSKSRWKAPTLGLFIYAVPTKDLQSWKDFTSKYGLVSPNPARGQVLQAPQELSIFLHALPCPLLGLQGTRSHCDSDRRICQAGTQNTSPPEFCWS